MLQYELPAPEQKEPGFWKKHGWWLIPLIIVDVTALVWWLQRDEPTGEPVSTEVATPITEINSATETAKPFNGIVYGFPTAQHQLLDTNTAGIYMPTGSGRPESGMYGSVRSSTQGKLTMSSFHEGLDIAPLERDRSQMPRDDVLAVADGRVAYFNKIAGNSNYGKYIVLMHDDPLGETYTLYAHLAQVYPDVVIGKKVSRGDKIGLMGNSASTGIPVGRAHVHFETGMMLNRYFHGWYKRQKLKPDHGNYHGHNLAGVNPYEVLRWQNEHGYFSMAEYMAHTEPAFSLVIRAAQIPDYFIRYPGLWAGGKPSGNAMVITVSEGGVPLSGRPATEQERTLLGSRRHHILSVNEDVLGRNGLHLVTKRKGQWILGKNGERWLEVLTYH
jgi:murein DD-endopeptidase MepM/ murein hydrolase activator NlpD